MNYFSINKVFAKSIHLREPRLLLDSPFQHFFSDETNSALIPDESCDKDPHLARQIGRPLI
jgi:hypothetical protein